MKFLKKLIRRLPWLGPRLVCAVRRRRIGRLAPPVYVGNGRLLVQDWLGHMLYLDAGDISMTPTLAIHRCWEDHIAWQIIRTVTSGMNVVEVGAHVGIHTITLAVAVGVTGRVFAFEPNPPACELLRDNLLINAMADRVEVIESAVLDRDGEVEFQSFGKIQACSHVGPKSQRGYEANKNTDTLQVPGVSLDSFFAGRDMPIHLIKIDAEGCEPDIFAGMAELLDRNPGLSIICEFNTFAMRDARHEPGDLLHAIEQMGFRIQRLDPQRGLRKTSHDELLAADTTDLYLTR